MSRWQIPAVLGLLTLVIAGLAYVELTRGPLTVTLSKPRDLPSIPLYDELGNVVALNAGSGGWLLIFPGFTHCPDICPSTLSRLAAIADELAPVQVILFSVDPERDTPTRLREYVTHFHPNFGVRVPTSVDHLASAAAALGIAYRKVSLPGTYTIDHSVAMPLIGPDGRVRAFFADFTDPDSLVLDIRAIMNTHDESAEAQTHPVPR